VGLSPRHEFGTPLSASRAFAALSAVVVLSVACSETTAVSRATTESCAVVSTFAENKAPDRIRHVASDGSDSAGDGSATRPFQSLARAAHNLSPGTAIYLHAGTYAGGLSLSDIRGTVASPIWIAGAPGESRPIIQGGGDGLHFVRPRYLVIQDLEIRDAASNGIEFGAHTQTHPILSAVVSQQDLAAEIAGSKLIIEERLDREVAHFCYPNGSDRDFTPATVQAVRDAGFRTATTTMPGMVSPATDALRLRRVGVEPALEERYFAECAAGLHIR